MGKYQFLHTGNYVKILLHNIPEIPGVIAKITGLLANCNINVLTLRHSVRTVEKGDIAFTVSKDNADEAIQLMESNKSEIGASEITVKRDLALVFIRGDEIEHVSHFISDISKAFSEYDVDFDSLTVSADGITCILPDDQYNQAMHAFNKMFVDDPIISPI
ncbi:hypothetical protein JW960_17520 [candidate division KSB1 bacterium]|nr:hypothetical protein [candidate division KSB1 bacterium]